MSMHAEKKSAGAIAAALKAVLTLSALSGALAHGLVAAAEPDAYPTKAVRFIVPFAPGGGADLLARLVGMKAAEGLGQQVVIDNRPGAGGNIGAEITARSAADGYTLLEANVSHAISASLYKSLNYDLVKDFSAVTQLASTSFMLTVAASSPVGSIKDLIASAKASPTQLNYGSAGGGSPSHLAMELFNSLAGISSRHIPYKGATPALADLMSGQLQMMFNTLAVAMPLVKGAKLKGLAVTSSRRISLAPDYPTLAESGLAGYEATTWYGVMAPTGTPAPVIAKLHRTFVTALNSPDIQDKLANQSFELVGSSPVEFAAYVRAEIPKWAKVVKSSDAKPD